MSTPNAHPQRQPAGGGNVGGLLGRLPSWLAPRDRERRGRGEQRLIETFILVVIGIVIAVATVHDLSRQVGIGERLHADLVSWEHYTGHIYHNPLLEQDVEHYTTRDVFCANTEKGKPQGKVQICLIFTGPVKNGLREATGGYYLIAEGTDVHKPVLNEPKYSYGCFGSALTERTGKGEPICALAKGPPKPSSTLLAGGS